VARGKDLQVEVDDVPAGDHVGVARAEALAQYCQERSLGGDAGDGRRGYRWPDEKHLPRTARASEGHRGDRAGPVGLDVEGEPRQRPWFTVLSTMVHSACPAPAPTTRGEPVT
jgi:hypothetical protein